MMQRLRRGAMLAAMIAVSGAAAAQGPHAVPPNPMQSLAQDQNRDQPVQIDAATLEVRDKSKMATFSGNVRVVQGDTTMKCRTLVVFYGQEVGIGADSAAATGVKAAATGTKTIAGMPKGAQNIRRIEARGNVTVVTKDQNASGDLGVYDLQSKTITLSGNVVVSQGQNVIHGERVVVDMVTGNARVESAAGAAQHRVRALIMPNKGEKGGATNFMTVGPNRAN